MVISYVVRDADIQNFASLIKNARHSKLATLKTAFITNQGNIFCGSQDTHTHTHTDIYIYINTGISFS